MKCVLLIIMNIGVFLKVASAVDNGVSDAGNELDNDAFIKNFDDVGYNTACEWMGMTDPAKLKLNLSREISYEDATKLTFLNKGRKLHENLLEFPDDIKWKRELVNQMWSIYEASCPNIFVNENYMNIMRELAMVYLNSVEPRTSPDPEVWTAISESLVECGNKKFPPYNFTTAGLLIEKLIQTDTQAVSGGENNDNGFEQIDDGNSNGTGTVEGNKQLTDVQIQTENAQLVYYLDIIIDNLWQVFSHAFARCLRTAPSKELWGPRFKQLFFRDILEPLEERWANPGEGMMYFLDFIMGDYDVSRNQANIPYCTQAAYLNPSGTLLVSQLVRPIKLTEIERGVGKFQNTRV